MDGSINLVIGLIILGFIVTVMGCIFIVNVFRLVRKKNKEINIKDHVIEIQKEIIESQPGILTRNHDN